MGHLGRHFTARRKRQFPDMCQPETLERQGGGQGGSYSVCNSLSGLSIGLEPTQPLFVCGFFVCLSVCFLYWERNSGSWACQASLVLLNHLLSPVCDFRTSLDKKVFSCITSSLGI